MIVRLSRRKTHTIASNGIQLEHSRRFHLENAEISALSRRDVLVFLTNTSKELTTV